MRITYCVKQVARIRKEAFRVSSNKAQKKLERKRKIVKRKRRIQYRLRDINWTPQDQTMLPASKAHYELADRVRGLAPGESWSCTWRPGGRGFRAVP